MMRTRISDADIVYHLASTSNHSYDYNLLEKVTTTFSFQDYPLSASYPIPYSYSYSPLVNFNATAPGPSKSANGLYDNESWNL